ncbi:hypothetical protein PVAP13_1NG170138 [Panicum virgatum]|uniref:Uncharacterized protein n=1 Tax=Panicum virgatum TaxID=38727 RepID=A0A8T0WMB1_PANVG|nr:hypothetical protein PVAP13_1NG170138 [Panicum virgatum]
MQATGENALAEAKLNSRWRSTGSAGTSSGAGTAVRTPRSMSSSSTNASHLLKYDSMLGTTISVDGKPITVVSSRDPRKPAVQGSSSAFN